MLKIKERTFSGTRDKTVSKRELRGREAARKAAEEGIILLQNENSLLPLKEGTRIAVYGSGASRTVIGGTGSGDVNERESVSIYQGLKNAGCIITNETWILDYEEKYKNAKKDWRDSILRRTSSGMDSTHFFEIYTSMPFHQPAGILPEKTDADVILYVLSRTAGEGADRHEKDDFCISETENRELERICSFCENVILILNVGGPMDLTFLDTFVNIHSVLLLSQPGMEGGNALADILFGKITPSGRLTDSWAYHYADYPNAGEYSYINGNVKSEYYTEGIYVGYRYFDSFQVPVRYGFGYGLSYTIFDIRLTDIRIGEEDEEEKRSGEVFLTLSVTNKGSRAGKEVIQVYVSCPAGNLEKEKRRLAGFAKSHELIPGETEKIQISIPLDILSSYSISHPGWILEKGIYGVWIGNCLQESELRAGIELNKDVLIKKTEHICTSQNDIDEFHVPEKIRQEIYKKICDNIISDHLPVAKIDSADLRTEIIEYRNNAEFVQPEERQYVDNLTEDQLKLLVSGDPGKAQGSALGAAGISVPGSAGETSRCAEEQGLASIVLADGPAGLRLMQYYFVKDGKIVNMPFQFSLEGGVFCPDADKTEGERYYQYCTAIPVGTLLAQTWNTQLIEKTGQMIGGEMQEFGITLWLAPGMNIHRNPLCGRNFEYYSEDPLLSGKIAAAMTHGVQKVGGCGTTIKHFVCNNQEDNRMNSDSIISERTLREIYLKGFEIAIREAQPMAIMTSYNLINGVHSANNKDLCTKAARCEFGFKGLIMTDWTTTENGPDCTAAGCIRAGNDLIMPGCAADQENLSRELEEGTLQKEDLRACAGRVAGLVRKSSRYI